MYSTFVTRGLKYISKDRDVRIQAIADALARSDYDIVNLQELWVFADFELIRNATSKKLPFCKYFYRSVSECGRELTSSYFVTAAR